MVTRAFATALLCATVLAATFGASAQRASTHRPGPPRTSTAALAPPNPRQTTSATLLRGRCTLRDAAIVAGPDGVRTFERPGR